MELINIYKIFNQCDEIIIDYCFDHNIHRKVIAKEMGISPKQLNNILLGEVEGCFDIIVTIFAKFVGESAFRAAFEELFSMLQEREEYITSKNLFTLYELSIIVGQKTRYINGYLKEQLTSAKLTKAIKQTIQMVFVIEKMFTYDEISDLNLQSASINADYAQMFQPLENKEIVTHFLTFLDFCINMRRNERIAGYYYDQKNFKKASEVYAMLYELPSGKDNQRYLGYKLLQSLSQAKDYENFKRIVARVMHIDAGPFKSYLDWYIDHEYYLTKDMPTLLHYWFTRNKDQLILSFEHSKTFHQLCTIKLLLTNLTESCSYIL